MRPGARVFAFLVILALLAGCTRDAGSPAERTFSASGGKASLGWAYDGATVEPAGATLAGTIRNAENTGNATATFQLAGSTWTIVFDTFSQGSGKDFQDGGVAFDLREHGDTGVADASIPTIHAIVAAWGSARVERDGALAAPEPWTAHLMISADTVRGADGKITKADGTTPYDPNAPSDARRVEGDRQAFLFVKHPQGETFSRPAVEVSATASCQGPACTQTVELPIEQGATSAVLNFTATGPDPTLPLGPLGEGTITIVDAEGTELGAAGVSPSPQGGPPTTIGLDLKDAVFPLSMIVAGDGIFTVAATGTASFDDLPFIVLTWDEVEVN